MGCHDSLCANGWRRLVKSEISMLFWSAEPGLWTLTTCEETDSMSAAPGVSLGDKPLSDNAADSYTMPARLYTDPDVFEQEKRQFLPNPGITSDTRATSPRLVTTSRWISQTRVFLSFALMTMNCGRSSMSVDIAPIGCLKGPAAPVPSCVRITHGLITTMGGCGTQDLPTRCRLSHQKSSVCLLFDWNPSEDCSSLIWMLTRHPSKPLLPDSKRIFSRLSLTSMRLCPWIPLPLTHRTPLIGQQTGRSSWTTTWSATTAIRRIPPWPI